MVEISSPWPRRTTATAVVRDYRFRDDDGRDVPVAEMADADIRECLANGVEPLDGEPADAIRDRLNLELLIREKGLRTP